MRFLKKNIENYSTIVPIKAALWGAEEKRVVKNRNKGHWGYTVTDTDNIAESMGQQIDCITISALMEKYSFDKIDLLKMDIEGGEKDVLQNSSAWIAAVNVMTVELHDRICPGCEKAFHLSTQNFRTFETRGEKITAYRI